MRRLIGLRNVAALAGGVRALATMCVVGLVGAGALAGCGGGRTGTSGDDGGTVVDAGSEQGAHFALHAITQGGALNDLTMAVAVDGRIGLAWFETLGPRSGMSGVTDYELRYAEWRDGQLSEPEAVRVVQLAGFGLTLAFDADGRPALSYLGGDDVTQTGGTSVFWLQSDAVVARRRADGTWAEEIVAKHSDDAPAGNDVSDTGYLVGLYPALAFASDGRTFLAWRDSHGGQNQQDAWAGSDIELAEGGEGAWTREVVVAGGKDKQGYGGHLQMVLAEGRPALVSDRILGGPNSIGSDVVFSRKGEDGQWNAKVRPFSFVVGNTGEGPSLAHDPVLGFAIAVVDRSDDSLWFTRSVNEGQNWSEADPVFHAGSGGWYPSLSVHPSTHDPSIAFYVCARAAGVAQGSCPERDDALRVTERIGGQWRELTVDEAGGFRPVLRHLADGRRVIAYRDPREGAVKLAVEK